MSYMAICLLLLFVLCLFFSRPSEVMCAMFYCCQRRWSVYFVTS